MVEMSEQEKSKELFPRFVFTIMAIFVIAVLSIFAVNAIKNKRQADRAERLEKASGEVEEYEQLTGRAKVEKAKEIAEILANDELVIRDKSGNVIGIDAEYFHCQTK